VRLHYHVGAPWAEPRADPATAPPARYRLLSQRSPASVVRAAAERGPDIFSSCRTPRRGEVAPKPSRWSAHDVSQIQYDDMARTNIGLVTEGLD